MGRIKPRFPIETTIRTAPNKKGEVSIYLVYNVDSITVAKTTGIKILPSDWDEKEANGTCKEPRRRSFNQFNEEIKG